MELLSSGPFLSDGKHSCDSDGAYQRTWARVYTGRGGKSTTGMWWRADPGPRTLFTYHLNCRIGFTTL